MDFEITLVKEFKQKQRIEREQETDKRDECKHVKKKLLKHIFADGAWLYTYQQGSHSFKVRMSERG